LKGLQVYLTDSEQPPAEVSSPLKPRRGVKIL